MKLYTGTPTIRQWTKFFTPEKRYGTKEKITPKALDSSGKLCYNIVYIEDSCFGRKEYKCYQSRTITAWASICDFPKMMNAQENHSP